MITVSNVSLAFGGSVLFKDVNLTFSDGNCYGVIGANGAGKSTFLKILSGEIQPTTGEVAMPAAARMSVLKQDHFAFDAYSVLDTILMGNPRLYEILKQKDALYMKSDFTEADGVLASELEGEFAELNGWEAETEAAKLLAGLSLGVETLEQPMTALGAREKVKVLLAQALFGAPDIILLDEPTNHLDIQSIAWLEEFLINYPGTLIVVSHDRHFLNNVCTQIVDVDFGKIRVFPGNYDFWYQSSQLTARLIADQHKKADEKIKELQAFIQRFSANKSKSNQATSRKKTLDKLTYEQLPVSSRRYPFVSFQIERELGKEVLFVDGLTKTVDGVKVLNNVSFTVGREDKIAFVSDNDLMQTTLFKILNGEMEPDAGTYKWGVSTVRGYIANDNAAFFDGNNMPLVEWLAQYSKDQTQTYLRGFLGKMLFSGDDVFKPVNVLSGGERVRCMLSRMMMFGSNVLVADQPTNHLDLESITAVNNGFTAFKGVLLFSSHDHELIETVANRIIELTPDGLIDRPTTYDDYLTWRAAHG